jgi:hypothetical protein
MRVTWNTQCVVCIEETCAWPVFQASRCDRGPLFLDGTGPEIHTYERLSYRLLRNVFVVSLGTVLPTAALLV